MKRTLLEKIQTVASLATITLITLLLTACPPGPDPDIMSEPLDNPVEKVDLRNCKLSVKYDDLSFGDDYYQDYKLDICLYFYSELECVLYEKVNNYFSDMGRSITEYARFYTYEIEKFPDGTYITLTEFTNDAKMPYYIDGIKIKDGRYYIDDNSNTVLTKSSIDYNDQMLLGKMHGKSGEVDWYYDFQKSLFIKGHGFMADYNSSNCPWRNYNLKYVYIDGTVKSIGDYAFYESTANIDFEDSGFLERIGNYAMKGTDIRDLYLINIHEIGEEAFANCKNLIYVDFEKSSLGSIGDYAFYNCSNLLSVKLNLMLEEIGHSAFLSCKKAEISGFDNTHRLRKIGALAFQGPLVKGFTPSMQLEEVGPSAFSRLNVETLNLPNSLKILNSDAFCGSFSKIKIGPEVQTINSKPFKPSVSSGIVEVQTPNPVTLDYNLLGDVTSGWELNVPSGSKAAYSNAPYWKNFKKITDGTNDDEDKPFDVSKRGDVDYMNEYESIQSTYSLPITYKINGKSFKTILVSGGSMPDFYIMQTELPPDAVFEIGGVSFGKLDTDGDQAVLAREFNPFLKELRATTGIPFRLPTEEEWKFAAKGGNKSQGYTYSGSNDINEVAWYKNNSSSSVHGVAEKKANELGLYDMSGNYEEACYQSTYFYGIDGPTYGGNWNDAYSKCTSNSKRDGVVNGTNTYFKRSEAGLVDARYITFRFVYSARK